MNATEQIRLFHDFLNQEKHLSKVIEIVRKGEKSLFVDFRDISKFNIELAEEILFNPEDAIKAAEIAIQDLTELKEKCHIHFRITNIPNTQEIKIKNVRSKHLGNLLFLKGIVRQKSGVKPHVTTAKFECPSCGNIINIIQLDEKFREPSRCSCGRKGKFKLIGKELVDAQGIVIEEAPEDLEGGEQPKRINIFLKDDLVSPITEKQTNPGAKVVIIGVLKEIPITLRQGGISTRYDLLIEANNIWGEEETFADIKISKKEKQEILELANDPRGFSKIVKSIAPSIYGHEKIKEAITLQLFGGIRKKRTDGVITRGDIHILLIGDPGAGKSQLLKRIGVVAPKGRFVSGKGTSGAGLTAAVVKDEFLKGWTLEAGALVLANNGIACIDELDKMSREDQSAMHEALEQQTITISKANIQATLRAETSVLAAANPRYGRFDPFSLISEQIDMPPTLLNRFDLIFPIKDIPNAKTDEVMAKFILEIHQTRKIKDEEISTQLLRKYIAYAKQNIHPVLTDVAVAEIKDYYVKMRMSGSSDEQGIKSIPISARQLEALIRLSEAAAKMRLSNKVTKKDARRAIDLLHHCLTLVGMDSETGTFDIDRISTGIPASRRNKIILIKEIIEELQMISSPVPIEDILETAREKGIKGDLDEIIVQLKSNGEIYEPKRGFIQKI